MTLRKPRTEKIEIYGEYISTHDSTWGCLHMLRQLSPTQFLVLRARLEDLRFYIATRRRGAQHVTMITVDLTGYPRIGLALQKTEKPLYLCPTCQAAMLRRTRHCHHAVIPTYPRA